MKNDVMPSIVRMEKEVLGKLVKEVKETIATDLEINRSAKRSFGVVDLWKIQKGRKYTGRFLRTQ